MLIELDPVDRITADAVGEAGARTFYLQARKNAQLVTLLVEKQQVQLLAASVVEILSRLGKETGEGPAEESMGLEEPVEPQWRAGRLSIGYAEERDLLMLEVEELVPDDEDEIEGEHEEGPGTLPFEFATTNIPEEAEGPDQPDWEEQVSELSEELEELEELVAAEGDTAGP